VGERHVERRRHGLDERYLRRSHLRAPKG
jgi:hypothetical protein